MLTAILCVLSIISPLTMSGRDPKKGVCDQTKECARYTFTGDERALCLGYYGCKGATFEGTANPICAGAKACFRARFEAIPEKVICNGWQSCVRARGPSGGKTGLTASGKISCNGFDACTYIVGAITAPEVLCDGDKACAGGKRTQSHIDAVGQTLEGEDPMIYCNGNRACFQSRLTALDGRVYCDGDSACREDEIKTKQVDCTGKRVCMKTRIEAKKINAFGWFGIADSEIYGDQGSTLDIKAYGFNALALTHINTRGATTTIKAYGHKALSGADIFVSMGSHLDITCKTNACKGTPVYVDKKSTVTVNPAACDPESDDYEPSKKDITLPGKVQGIHCPIIIRGSRPPNSDLESQIAAYRELMKTSDEYLEIMEELEIENEEWEKYEYEQTQTYNMLPVDDDENMDDAEFYGDNNYLYKHSLSVNMNTNDMVQTIITSHVYMVALAAFIISGGFIYCCYRYKMNMDNNYKPLLN